MSEFVLTDAMKEAMINAAKDAYPREACGVVAGGLCYRLPNASESPESTFRIRAEDLAEVYESAGGYDAIWHTHPSGRTAPSRADWAHHPAAKVLVVATRTEVNAYYGPGPASA